jgi:hypothetical protein
MGVNNQHKDSVFSLLFNDAQALRELYGAFGGAPLDPHARIEITTLSDVPYMEQHNNISFTVDNRLVVLIKHQSTINSNMSLRLLALLPVPRRWPLPGLSPHCFVTSTPSALAVALYRACISPASTRRLSGPGTSTAGSNWPYPTPSSSYCTTANGRTPTRTC